MRVEAVRSRTCEYCGTTHYESNCPNCGAAWRENRKKAVWINAETEVGQAVLHGRFVTAEDRRKSFIPKWIRE